MARNFETLRVWQQSHSFVNAIYDIMESVRDYGFRDQIQRAAVSIMKYSRRLGIWLRCKVCLFFADIKR